MVNQKAQSSVQHILDSVTGDSSKGIAGLVFVAVDKHGQELVASASGKKGINSQQPMDLDTIFWIASCTKLLATIACLQAVEQGKLKLDDHQHLYSLCPELEKVQVLQDDGTLVPKTNDITLRMLLNHTSGFGYEFFNPKLRDFGRPIGYDMFASPMHSVLRMPLVHQPGTSWEYGIGIDWAGIALHRATGTSLNDWLQTHVCAPLGLTHTTLLPTAAHLPHLAAMHQRWPGSTHAAAERDHIYREPLLAASDPTLSPSVFHSGGAGAFARPTEYAQILACLLNDGVHAPTGHALLAPATVAAMFANQIPQHPDFARRPTPDAKPEQTNPVPEFYPQPGDPAQGWGLSFMITQAAGLTGRGAGTGWWAGIANCFWWVDRERGVAGMIAAQVMPFGDAAVMGAWGAGEAAVYAALDDEGGHVGGAGKRGVGGVEAGEVKAVGAMGTGAV